MIIGDMEIRLRADLARLQRDMTQARQIVNETAAMINRAAAAIRTALVGAFAVTAIIDAGRALIETQRAFDKLNASLVTATGSAASAKQAFGALQAFAATTPFGLKEVTEGFIKLRNLGMTPSERALTSYGNTASAMSKSLNQMIEAVADAASGEFERLKEFGIKAQQNGDKVSLTFQGVTTSVANNATAIEKYLIELGETKFGGSMDLQARTLDGAISNLGDTWKATKRKFSQGGFGDLAQASTMALTNALNDLGAILDAVSGKAKEEGKAVKETSLLHASLTTVFETVAVLGLNVAYVFKQVGNEVGGLAAQAAAVAKGDFALAKQIGVQMRADAAAARAEVDAKSEAILQAGNKARKAAEEEAAAKKAAGRDDLAQYAIKQQAAGKSAEALKKEAEAAKKAEEEYRKLIDRINGKENGQDADFHQNLALLKKGYDAGKQSLEAYVATVEAYIKQQPASIDLERERSKELEESNRRAAQAAAEMERLYTTRADAAARAIEQAEQEADRNEQLVATMGMEKSAIEALEVARLQEQLAQRSSIGMTLEEITETERLIAAKQRTVAALAQFEELSRQKQFWIDVDRTAHDTFVSIMDGSKSAAQRLKDTFKNVFFDWLYRMTLKKWIVNLQGQFSAGSVGGAASALGGSTDLLSIGSQIYSGFAGGLTGGLSSLLSTIGNTVGSSYLSAVGAGLKLTGAQAAAAAKAYTAAGNSTVASGLTTGSSSATAIPYIGWIIAGMMANNSFFKQGWDINGQTGDITKMFVKGSIRDSLALNPLGSLLMTTGALATTGIGAADKLLRGVGLSDQMASLLSGSSMWTRAFGRKKPEVTEQGITGTISASGFSGEAYAEILEKGGWFRSDKRYQKTSALDAGQDADFDTTIQAMIAAVKGFGGALGAETSAIDGYNKSIKLTLTADEEKNKAAIAAMFSGIGDELSTLLVPNLSEFSAAGETAAATLQRLAGNYQAIDEVLRVMGASGELAFGAVGVASLAARERLLTLTGGLDALASQSAFFTQNFLAEAERLAPVQAQVTAKMAELSMVDVDTIEEFAAEVKKLTTGGQLATEAGAGLYAELMKIAPAFKVVADANAAAAQKAAEDAATTAQRLADVNAPYLERIAALEVELGYATAARDAETAAMDASTRALYDKEQALLAEQVARDATTQSMLDFVSRQSGAAATAAQVQTEVAARATRQAELEIQLYNLTHTAAEQVAAARERELATLDPVARGLQQQIYAQQDLADAATAAAKQIEDAAARARAVAQERAGLERSILQLQGNTAELRKLELAALAPENRARQEQYYALQDKMAAEAEAARVAQMMAEAQARAAEEAKRAAEALKAAWQSATDSIFDEVKRIRGLIDGGGATTLAGAQSAFAIATAQARAGDQDAAKLLPGLSRTLLDLAQANAVTSFDLRLARARTSASLALTGQMLGSQYGVALPSFDVGTDYVSRTGLALIHEGERITPAASNKPFTRDGGGSADVVAELRQLRAENRDMAKRLDAALYAIAKYTQTSADHIDTWNSNGMPEVRETVEV